MFLFAQLPLSNSIFNLVYQDLYDNLTSYTLLLMFKDKIIIWYDIYYPIYKELKNAEYPRLFKSLFSSILFLFNIIATKK